MMGTVISLACSFVAMIFATILSSISAKASRDGNTKKAEKFSIYSAVFTAVSGGLTLLGIALVINQDVVRSGVGNTLTRAGTYVKGN